MLISLWILLGLLLALHAYREYWHRRDLPQIYTGEFEGELMKAGTTYIARRPARNDSQRTIVCFPGFLHDMRYFQEVYREHDAELILVNNANYHCPRRARQEMPLTQFRIGFTAIFCRFSLACRATAAKNACSNFP